MELEDPKLAPEHREVLAIKQNLLKLRENHEQFYTDMEMAEDGFGKVAEYFGKCLFTPHASDASTATAHQLHEKRMADTRMAGPAPAPSMLAGSERAPADDYGAGLREGQRSGVGGLAGVGGQQHGLPPRGRFLSVTERAEDIDL